MNVSCIIDGEVIRLSMVYDDGTRQLAEVHVSRPEVLAATIKSAYERGYNRGWDEAEAHHEA